MSRILAYGETTDLKLSWSDFSLFWGWITHTSSNAAMAQRADTEKLHRVFFTLDMFESNVCAIAFVESWNCVNENAIFQHEMRNGLALLTPPQHQKLERFISALKMKEKERVAKEKQTQKILRTVERRRKREDCESLEDHQKRPNKHTYLQMKSSRVHSVESFSGEAERQRFEGGSSCASESEGEGRVFQCRDKYDWDVKRVSLLVKTVSYFKSLMKGSIDTLETLKTSLHSPTQPVAVHPSKECPDTTSTVERSSVRSFHSIEEEQMGNDNDNRSLTSEDGFTSRLSMVSLLQYRKEKWGDETRSYEVPLQDVSEDDDDDESVNPFNEFECDDDGDSVSV